MQNFFLAGLALVFITLKLIGAITWSWWWVTAPLWGGMALALSIFVIGIIVVSIAALLTK